MNDVVKANRNREIMLRFLEDESVANIALRYDIHEATVAAILRRPEVSAEIERLGKLTSEEYLRSRIVGAGVLAFETIRDTMQGMNSSELKFKAAKDLLDRHPLFKDRSPAGEIAQGLGEAIIMQLAKQAAQAQAQPIDVTQKPDEADVESAVSTTSDVPCVGDVTVA